jgi:superfamily II DNA/RNA helicase
MFSATFNKEFRKLAKQYLNQDHVRLRVGRAGSSHHNVVQNVRMPQNCEELLIFELNANAYFQGSLG